jgi:signal transduction histidine kinase
MAYEKVIFQAIILSIIFLIILIFSFLIILRQNRMKRIGEKERYKLELKNKELEMMNAVVLAQEAERTKIARNLHDEIGAILSMAQRNLKAVLKTVPKEDSIREDISFTVDVLDQSISKIRSISHEMIPHYLVKFGLKKTLQRLTEQTQKTLSNPCTFTSEIEDNLHLDQQNEIHFYCTILELLNNVLKHAHPSVVHLYLDKKGKHLHLKLEHDGIAISQTDYEYLRGNTDGIGLESITHRLNLISGELLFQRFSKGGTIELAMPIIITNHLINEKVQLS